MFFISCVPVADRVAKAAKEEAEGELYLEIEPSSGYLQVILLWPELGNQLFAGPSRFFETISYRVTISSDSDPLSRQNFSIQYELQYEPIRDVYFFSSDSGDSEVLYGSAQMIERLARPMSLSVSPAVLRQIVGSDEERTLTVVAGARLQRLPSDSVFAGWFGMLGSSRAGVRLEASLKYGPRGLVLPDGAQEDER